MRGTAATLLLGVQMGQLPDASFLQGLAAATAHRLTILGAHDWSSETCEARHHSCGAPVTHHRTRSFGPTGHSRNWL